MLTDPRSPFFQLAADLSRKAHDAALGNLHARVVPEAEKPPQTSRQTADMSNTDPAEALDAVWEAGEALDALREGD